MPTVSEVQQQVDTWLDPLLPLFEQAQETYFTSHGCYFQGLQTHATPPADGAWVLPDIELTTPSDQPVAWREAIPADAPHSHDDPMPCLLRMDSYEHQDGPGWMLTARVVVAGVTYERRVQVGPETWRSVGWREVVEPQVEV
jgi:hypothetical protein